MRQIPLDEFLTRLFSELMEAEDEPEATEPTDGTSDTELRGRALGFACEFAPGVQKETPATVLARAEAYYAFLSGKK